MGDLDQLSISTQPDVFHGMHLSIDFRRFLWPNHGRLSCGGESTAFADHTPKVAETLTLEDSPVSGL